MKNLILHFTLLTLIFASCTSNSENKATQADSTMVKQDTVNQPVQNDEILPLSELPVAFADLVPIDLLESKSADVFEKYGIEFSGNCYSCDLAKLSITKNNIRWTNVCDDDDSFEIADFSCTKEDQKIMVKTAERTYIITQIDQAPVYELIIEGKKLELDNKRLSRYFTTKAALPLFKEHDCGDFEG